MQTLLDLLLPVALAAAFVATLSVGWQRRTEPWWVVPCGLAAAASGYLAYHSWVGDFLTWLVEEVAELVVHNWLPLLVLLACGALWLLLSK